MEMPIEKIGTYEIMSQKKKESMYACFSDTHSEQFLVEQLWAIESLEDGLALRVSSQEVRCSDESIGTEV